MFHLLAHLINCAIGSVVLLSLAIMLCALVFEDATTVIVAVLAADGIIPVPIAVISLLVGILAGDVALYSIGALARTHPRLAHYIDHEFTAPFKKWLERRYTFTIFTGHFVPGLRFTTYMASGFFRFPLSTYISMAVVSSLVWETVLFSAFYLFGSFSAQWLGHLRWGVALIFLLALFFVGRHNVLAYRADKKESGL